MHAHKEFAMSHRDHVHLVHHALLDVLVLLDILEPKRGTAFVMKTVNHQTHAQNQTKKLDAQDLVTTLAKIQRKQLCAKLHAEKVVDARKIFVKDSNGNCVKLSDCPKPIPTCGKNEKPSNCSRFCFEKRCEGFFKPQPVCKPGPCNTPTCICKDGFYRDENDKCVTAAQCKADGCKKPHTEYSECTGPCDATCENPNLPLVCKMACGPGCKCKDGYVKDEDGDCVKLNNCPKEPTPKCGVNEELNKCSTICGEATCETRVTRHCGAGKCKPKCHCKPGYLRHPNGSCVLKERCPIIDPPRPKK